MRNESIEDDGFATGAMVQKAHLPSTRASEAQCQTSGPHRHRGPATTLGAPLAAAQRALTSKRATVPPASGLGDAISDATVRQTSAATDCCPAAALQDTPQGARAKISRFAVRSRKGLLTAKGSLIAAKCELAALEATTCKAHLRLLQLLEPEEAQQNDWDALLPGGQRLMQASLATIILAYLANPESAEPAMLTNTLDGRSMALAEHHTFAPFLAAFEEHERALWQVDRAAADLRAALRKAQLAKRVADFAEAAACIVGHKQRPGQARTLWRTFGGLMAEDALALSYKARLRRIWHLCQALLTDIWRPDCFMRDRKGTLQGPICPCALVDLLQAGELLEDDTVLLGSKPHVAVALRHIVDGVSRTAAATVSLLGRRLAERSTADFDVLLAEWVDAACRQHAQTASEARASSAEQRSVSSGPAQAVDGGGVIGAVAGAPHSPAPIRSKNLGEEQRQAQDSPDAGAASPPRQSAAERRLERMVANLSKTIEMLGHDIFVIEGRIGGHYLRRRQRPETAPATGAVGAGGSCEGASALAAEERSALDGFPLSRKRRAASRDLDASEGAHLPQPPAKRRQHRAGQQSAERLPACAAHTPERDAEAQLTKKRLQEDRSTAESEVRDAVYGDGNRGRPPEPKSLPAPNPIPEEACARCTTYQTHASRKASAATRARVQNTAAGHAAPQRAQRLKQRALIKSGGLTEGKAWSQARTKNLRFGRSRVHAWGLFAQEPIAAEEFVVEYLGEIVRPGLEDARERAYQAAGLDSSYLFRVGREAVIDATMKGGMARYINHSCEPNCYTKTMAVDGRKHIVIFSLRAIRAGEELLYDYNFAFESESAAIPCRCGAKHCRGRLN